jgi:hypothetical protein
MGHKNEDQIKQAIVDGRDAGRCDRNGENPVAGGSGGKGDRFRPVSKKYAENYDRIKWMKKEMDGDG